MQPLKWLISLLSPGTPSAQIRVGSRVHTPHGPGTVTNATACVDLDAGTRLRPSDREPRVNITSPLDSVTPLIE